MTTDCHRLDDYLDGRLPEPDAEAFETHTLSCADCDAALDAADRLDLSPLRDVTCPPAVLDAALRSARRAPDRTAVAGVRRSRFRLPLVALALATVAVLAIGLARIAAPDVPTPVVAERTVPVQPAPNDELPAPEPEAAPLAETPEPPAPPPLTPERPTPRRAPAPPPPVPTVSPAPSPTEAPQDAIAQGETPPEEDLSLEAVEAAQRDIALAFSLVAEAQTRAGDAIRTRAGSVSETLDQTLPF